MGLVHGWGFHGGIWEEVATTLAQDFRVTVVDLPGHGQSDDSAGEYTLETVARQLLDVFPCPVIWIGWSLGAMAGLMAARVRPSALTGMVLVGATPKFIHGPDWPHGLPAEQLSRFADELEHDYRRTLVRFLSLQAGAGVDARRLLKRLRAKMFDANAPTPRALRAGLAILRQADLRCDIMSIAVPIHLIHGERDKLVPLSAAEYLAGQLPAGTLDVVTAGGHVPFLSHPQLFLKTLTGFLHGSLDGPGSDVG